MISSIEQPSDWAEALNANPNPETDWRPQSSYSVKPRFNRSHHALLRR